MRIVRGRSAAPPVARRPGPLRIRAALAHQVRAQCLRNARLAPDPCMKVAGRQLRSLERIDQHRAHARLGAAAMHPLQREFSLGLERNLVGFAVDFRQHHHPRAGRQLGQAPRDGGQGGVVADEQVPVELRRHDERAARPAYAQRVAGLGVLGPLRGGAGVVQREVDLQRVRLRVVAARRVVAHRRAAARGPDRAIGPGRRQRQLARGRVGEKDLRVVVEPQAREAREVVAGQHDADEVRRDALHRLHRELAKAKVVAHAARCAVGRVGRRSGRRSGSGCEVGHFKNGSSDAL